MRIDGGAGLPRGVLLSCPEDLAQKAPHPLRRRRPEGFSRLFRTPGAGLAGQDCGPGGGGEGFPGGEGLVTERNLRALTEAPRKMEPKADTPRETAKRYDRDPHLFIVGCARSGTTLLHRIVDAHPEIAITPEMHWISHYFKNQNRLVTPELVSELAGHKRFAQFEIPREEFEGLLGSGEPVSYPTFLNGVFDLYGKIKNKPLVGNKTPAYVRSILDLHALWPEAKFVHIIRDGRDVCMSILNWKKAERIVGRTASWEDGRAPITSPLWARKGGTGREAGARLGLSLYYEMHYEDLVDDPERECKRLCEFRGVPY